jgi:hypothetical protein
MVANRMMRGNVGMRVAVRCATAATTSDASDHPVIFNQIANSDFAIAATLPIAVMPPTLGGAALSIAARSSVTRMVARHWNHHRTHHRCCVLQIIPGNYCPIPPWRLPTQQRLANQRTSAAPGSRKEIIWTLAATATHDLRLRHGPNSQATSQPSARRRAPPARWQKCNTGSRDGRYVTKTVAKNHHCFFKKQLAPKSF